MSAPAWIRSQRKARGLCENCGGTARTEDPFGRLWCWPCWDVKTDALEVTGSSR